MLEGRGYGVQENGFRSPTYPVLLALILAPFERTHLAGCRDAHRAPCIDNAAKTADGDIALTAIVVIQILLGGMTTAVLFALGWRLTRNILVATLFGAGYALNLATAFWEISILTETVTTFLLALAVYLTVLANRAKPEVYLALGVVLAALSLCHQLFLGYWVLSGAFLMLRAWGEGDRRGLPRIALALFLPLAFVTGWSIYNYSVNGVFTPSTLSGYVLIQMVAPIVQNAPEGYDGIVQPYVGYRDAMIAQTGSYSGAIFRAWPAMMGWTGLTWSEISRKLTSLSFYLMLHYPQVYLQSARSSWVRFWDFQIYHYDPIPNSVPPWAVWLTDGAVQAAVNILFGISALVCGTILLARRRTQHLFKSIPADSILLLIATVLFAAIVTSLTNFQDNSRLRTYVLPMQYGSIALAAWACWRMVSNLASPSPN